MFLGRSCRSKRVLLLLWVPVVAKYRYVVGVWALLRYPLNHLFGFESLIELTCWVVTVDQHGLVTVLQGAMTREDVKYEDSFGFVFFQLFQESIVCVSAFSLAAVPNLNDVLLPHII